MQVESLNVHCVKVLPLDKWFNVFQPNNENIAIGETYEGREGSLKMLAICQHLTHQIPDS